MAASPAFDSARVTVVFVLGGPGAGKGTQSAKLVKDYGFVHLSAGDLLRAEQDRQGSTYGDLIREHIREGTIVPMEVTVKLLENAMRNAMQSSDQKDEAWKDDKGRFLVDGFPRQMDQAMKFEEVVCASSLVLFYTTSEEIMLERILERGKTSGREDDNVESIKKRFREYTTTNFDFVNKKSFQGTYQQTTMPVIHHYQSLGRVAEINASPTVDEVYVETRKAVDKVLQK